MKLGDFVWIVVICGISALLVIPSTHEVFIQMTATHPYVMAFIKFVVLATMGELLAVRMVGGQWKKTPGMVYKAIIWGVIGMLIALMFQVFSTGVAGAGNAGLLYLGDGFVKLFLGAFFTSAIMNLTFGPMFSMAHRISDTCIDMWARDGAAPSLSTVLTAIDWLAFIRFIVFKIQPFFWVPAHTIVFMLPPEYRVLAAAYLSIALGAILSYARRKQTA